MRVELDIDLGSDPIAGRLSVPGAEPRVFIGYTGLIAALETLRDGDGTDPGELGNTVPLPQTEEKTP
jgi:hypothetical protein